MSRMNDVIRTAVVGLGHGAGHARAIAARPDMRLAAVCDLNAERCRRCRGELEMPDLPAYADFARMLDETELDAVVIATPLQCHAEMAEAALGRGLHVLLEKPLARDLAEGRRIGEAARRAGRVCQLGFEMRSSPLMQKVKEIIASGTLGQVVLVWANMFRGVSASDSAWRTEKGLCRGIFFDCYVHEINEMLSWAGADFDRVAAFGAPVGATGANEDVPDTVTACIEFQGGVRASVCFSQVSKTTNDTHFGIVGTRGRIDGDPWQPEGAGSLCVYTDGGLFRTEITVTGAMASRGHLGFREQYDFFVRGIREGRTILCDVEDAIRTQRLMDALGRALSEGRVVSRAEMD